MSVSSVSNLYNNSAIYSTQAKEETQSKTSEKEITKEEVSKLINSSQASQAESLLNSFLGSGSSSNKASSGLMGLYESFGTLDLMRSGTYSKLVKKYYETLSDDGSSAAEAEKAASDSAAKLSRSAAAMKDGSLYEKVDIETKNEDGSVSVRNDYDRNAINSAVKGFVEDYNRAIDDMAESDDLRTLQKGVSMIGMTGAVSGLLSKAGITVNEDNTLSIDEEKLASADIADIKALFSGEYSYAATIGQKAAMVANNASISGYTANGSYNYTAYTSGIVNIQT